jgi:hypothetical protein
MLINIVKQFGYPVGSKEEHYKSTYWVILPMKTKDKPIFPNVNLIKTHQNLFGVVPI